MQSQLISATIVTLALLVTASLAQPVDPIESCGVSNVRQMLLDIRARYWDQTEPIELNSDDFEAKLKAHVRSDQQKRAEGVIRYFLAERCQLGAHDYLHLQRSKWFGYIEGPELDESLVQQARRLNLLKKESSVDSYQEAAFMHDLEGQRGWVDEHEIELACKKLDFHDL